MRYSQSEETWFLVIARNQVAGLVAAAVLIAASFTVALLIGRDTTHHSPETVVRDYLIVAFPPGLMILAGVMSWIIGLLGLILWIILVIQAGTGKMWKVPLAGDWAERRASK